ncbi:hypothetical protein GCM10009854_37500 [Saccharopolyspora halophila]|uniref:ABC transporter permease n=1 Tax=Saccharopolyspora halophila TaxID=405551 RepID=A0ABN3GMZ5_9PSEU
MNEISRQQRVRSFRIQLAVASLLVLLHGGIYLGMRTGVVQYGSLASSAIGCAMWSAALLAELAIFAYLRFHLGKWVVVVGLIAAPVLGALLYWALYGSLYWWQVSAVESNLKDPPKEVGVGFLIAVLVVLLVVAPALGVWTSRRMARRRAPGGCVADTEPGR